MGSPVRRRCHVDVFGILQLSNRQHHHFAVAILGAVAVLIIGIVATRALTSWLEERFLPETNLDVGVRSSIGTGAGYVGVILAALIALSYVGLNLQNVAIVAGALSVGIGFGLQSIINNFVSGLILLVERPIKLGIASRSAPAWAS